MLTSYFKLFCLFQMSHFPPTHNFSYHRNRCVFHLALSRPKLGLSANEKASDICLDRATPTEDDTVSSKHQNEYCLFIISAFLILFHTFMVFTRLCLLKSSDLFFTASSRNFRSASASKIDLASRPAVRACFRLRHCKTRKDHSDDLEDT